MSSLDMSVTLIVKAPNQQIEDQTIHCELSWTIKRLKGYLSEVYPSKPCTEEQKLIYSGRLLNDSCTLREVLRSYEEGQDQHTVHLVCARNSTIPQKNPDAGNSSSSSSENLRRRAVQTASSTSSNSSPATNQGNATEVSSSSLPSSSASNTNHPQNSNTSANGSTAASPQDHRQAVPPVYAGLQVPSYTHFSQMPPYVAPPQVIPWTQAQYAAWMHQAYAQYMAQYMQMMSQGSGNPFPWQWPPNVTMQGPETNYEQPGVAPGQAGNADRAPRADDADEDDNAGRDWLDWVYMTSRAAAFFAFVYFYTTPMRFLVVFCLGLLLYMYNTGFFRPLDDLVQVAENNNDPARVDAAAAAANNIPNNDNNNNHQPVPRNEPNAEAAAEPPLDGGEVNENIRQNNPDGTMPTPAAAPVEGRPSLLAVTWTFFTGFFASLIPEQPRVI